ncbi:MAG TPA: branched-chain amino acid ABC transporter substrate-binding protein, partial [Roseiflexaceae bacterium]|nr:branched-chain amino acid ABC transporter substrate-binding protein [Roseiflexaceae bacterium]
PAATQPTAATGGEPTAATGAEPTTAAPTTAASTGGSGETIRIVSSLPRQGASKGQTDAVVNAIKMRLEEDNYQACSGQFTIDYQDLDDATAAAGKWDAATETANANKAVGDPDVMVYIGTFNSGAAALSIPVLNQANLVMISPANTAVGLTLANPGDPGSPEKYYPSGKRNYTRVVTADQVQGAALAKWAQKLGAQNVYILDDQEVYGKGVAQYFEKSAKEIGLNVLGHDGIDGKAQNYSSLMTKIAAGNPDLVFFGGIVDNNAGQLLKDMRAAGMTPDKVKFMGPDGIQTDSFITAAGADVAEGAYATIAGLPADRLGEKGKAFYDNYQKKYGVAAESYGIYGYEAANVALAAINNVCKKDRTAILDAVFATKDFDGVLGKWSFDANGDTSLTDIQGFQVQGGKWVAANLYTGGNWEK